MTTLIKKPLFWTSGAGTVTVTGNVTVTANAWGAQTSATGPARSNSGSVWGAGSAWTLMCPSGTFLVGIRQTSGAYEGTSGAPGIICAPLQSF